MKTQYPNYAQLYAGLETCIGSFISDQGNKDSAFREMKTGVLVERAGAAIQRTIADFAGADRWLYFRVSADVSAASRVVTREIAPMLRRLKNSHPIKGWWWLYKIDSCGAAVRLRIFVPPGASREVEMAIGAQLAELGRDFRMLCYEPELRLFGGADGMRAAHEYFCADSEFLAAWPQESEPLQNPIIPEGLSVALILRVLRAWTYLNVGTSSTASARDAESGIQAMRGLLGIKSWPRKSFKQNRSESSTYIVAKRLI